MSEKIKKKLSKEIKVAIIKIAINRMDDFVSIGALDAVSKTLDELSFDEDDLVNKDEDELRVIIPDLNTMPDNALSKTIETLIKEQKKRAEDAKKTKSQS